MTSKLLVYTDFVLGVRQLFIQTKIILMYYLHLSSSLPCLLTSSPTHIQYLFFYFVFQKVDGYTQGTRGILAGALEHLHIYFRHFLG
jgi:hypothetical protein